MLLPHLRHRAIIGRAAYLLPPDSTVWNQAAATAHAAATGAQESMQIRQESGHAGQCQQCMIAARRAGELAPRGPVARLWRHLAQTRILRWACSSPRVLTFNALLLYSFFQNAQRVRTRNSAPGLVVNCSSVPVVCRRETGLPATLTHNPFEWWGCALLLSSVGGALP